MQLQDQTISEDLRKAIDWAKTVDSIDFSSAGTHLIVLSDYECWDLVNQCYEKLVFSEDLENLSDIVQSKKLNYAIDYLESLSLKQESPSLARACLQRIVREYKISFDTFFHSILNRIIEDSDAKAEVYFLEPLVEVFENNRNIESALERLSMLYEKKLHQTNLLEGVYSKILEVNPDNLKALKFFKLAVMQAGDWEEGASLLRRILVNARTSSERNRNAQELASLLLFQLDRPDEAVEVLASQTENSQLDNSYLLFESYRRLLWHEKAIELLNSLAQSEGLSKKFRAILAFKKGELFLEVDRKIEAIEQFKEALRHDVGFFEAYSRVISINLEEKNWELVHSWLAELKKNVADSELKDEIEFAAERLSHASGGSANV